MAQRGAVLSGNLALRLLGRIAEASRGVVVIGDEMTDVWVHGRVEECQDGCPKFVEESRCSTRGGAANAQGCLDHWGVRTRLFSAGAGMSSTKVRFVDPDGQVVYRWDEDIRVACPPAWSHKAALEMVPFAGAVLLSDYDKGFLTTEFVREVARSCAARGIPCVADAKRAPEVYSGYILKCNRDWAVKYNKDQWWHRKDMFVMTDGADRPVVRLEGYDSQQLVGNELPPVLCVNNVGAGDCFAAHLALALAYGFSLSDAARLAYSAGRVYVQSPHNRPPRPEEVAADLDGSLPLAPL